MSDTWIFGYGSLIWRPNFPFAERLPATIEGFARRFWQHSPDHRGTPDRPGRVVTLVREPNASCFGILYRVSEEVQSTLAALDHRERGGYERLIVDARTDEAVYPALLYIATEENPHYAGDSSLARMVEQVRGASGESGPNVEYVMN
ncbi:MAG: gamma-glutamylcyclotransferase, partial [Myxococcota bacterium]